MALLFSGPFLGLFWMLSECFLWISLAEALFVSGLLEARVVGWLVGPRHFVDVRYVFVRTLYL